MPRVRFNYSDGRDPVEFDTDEVMTYHVDSRANPGQRGTCISMDEKLGCCSLGYLIGLINDERPVVLANGRSDQFKQIISTKGVKSCDNLDVVSGEPS